MIHPAPPAMQEPAPAPDAAALLKQARELRSQKRFPEAVAVYTRMLEVWKDQPDALLERARTFSWMKRFDEAIRDLKRHREVHPELAAESEPVLARVTAWSGRFGEAVEILRPHVAKGDRQATLDTATYLSWDGRMDQSLAMADAWLQAHPADTDFHLLRGRVLGWRGRHGQARRAYQEALARTPGNRQAILGLAQLDLWAGDPETAERRLGGLGSEDVQSSEAELIRAQIDQRMGRLRRARTRAEALADQPDVREDAQARLRGLADAQGPWIELSQTRTDSNEGLRAQARRVDAAVPFFDGSLRAGASFDLLDQSGQAKRKPQEWSLGLSHPLGSRVTASAQVGRVDDVGGDAAGFHSLALGWRAAPGLNLVLSHTFAPNLATPRAVDLRTFTRTWGLGGTWVFNQTLDHAALSLERAFLSPGAARTGVRAEAGHRFPIEWGEWRAGLAARFIDQDQSLRIGFFNPERYRYYGATAGVSARREERWEVALDGWGGSQVVNRTASQFTWGYTLAGTWTPGGSAATLFASWSQSVAGLPIADPTDPTSYRDHTLRFGIRIRGNRWFW
ncbi:tetratricopeptide repeat protein [Geothrix alkalitolerans]|uniref:tetratricopeptide repeat protein n=1 Tax=Geothrix alkalitolerans TaxID=2922724 RepID=UPI001FB00BF0|nr:tetratricopeptide repeat protein [Geothrix alkalitolerans]